MKTIQTKGRGHRPLPRMAAAMGAALIVPLVACDPDELLRVEDPEFPTGLTPAVITAGAVGDFQRAYAGSEGAFHSEGFTTIVGSFTDEFMAAGTFTTRQAHDSRNLQDTEQGNHSDSAYEQLHRARRALASAAEVVAQEEGANAALRGEMLALEGFATVALGEGWCGAVPFSQEEGGEFVFGEPLSTPQIHQRAVARFEAALATEGFQNLASVGRGRALLNLGEYAAAAAAVQGVPTSFTYFVEHSTNTSRQANPWWGLQDNGRWSMSSNEGGGVAFRDGDPRTPWVFGTQSNPAETTGFNDQTPMFTSVRYPSRDANQLLADGIEARLIEAEAALHTGGDWLGILNDLRANYRSLMAARFNEYESWLEAGTRTEVEYEDLAPLTDPGTEAGRVDLIMEERARWLFQTGHRLGDLRRLVRQYGRNQADVFPSGPHHLVDVYGNDVSLPIPFDEINNDRYREAGGHDLCDTTQA